LHRLHKLLLLKFFGLALPDGVLALRAALSKWRVQCRHGFYLGGPRVTTPEIVHGFFVDRISEGGVSAERDAVDACKARCRRSGSECASEAIVTFLRCHAPLAVELLHTL